MEHIDNFLAEMMSHWYLKVNYNRVTENLQSICQKRSRNSYYLSNLQHVSGFIVPYIISDVTNKDYKIKFGGDTNNHDFVLHTTAMSPSSGQYSTNKNGIQRFHTEIPSGTTSQQIDFPQSHNLKPTVSIAIEAQNEIIPHTISGVNTNNYTIFLATESTEDYILHTISTEYHNQRIS